MTTKFQFKLKRVRVIENVQVPLRNGLFYSLQCQSRKPETEKEKN